MIYGLRLQLFKTSLVNVGLWYQSDACLTPATREIWQFQCQPKNWHFVKVPAALTYSAASWFLSGVLPDSLRFIGKSGVTWLCWQRRLMVEIRAAALELWIPKYNLLPSGRLQSLQGLDVSSLEKYNPSSWCCEQHIFIDMFLKEKKLSRVLLPRSSVSLFHTGAGFDPSTIEEATFPGWPLPPGLASVYPQLFSSAPLGTIAISSLGLCSLSFQLEAQPCSPFLLPHSTACQLSPDGCHLSFQSSCTGKLCLLLSRGGGALDGVSCCLATYFSLLQQWFSLAVPADAGTTNDSNITEAVAPVAVYLLFMVIVLKGFVNISSLPSLVKTDINL